MAASVAHGGTACRYGGSLYGAVAIWRVGCSGRNDLRACTYGYGCGGDCRNVGCKYCDYGDTQPRLQFGDSICCTTSAFGVGKWNLYRNGDIGSRYTTVGRPVCLVAVVPMDNTKGCTVDWLARNDIVLPVAVVVGGDYGQDDALHHK